MKLFAPNAERFIDMLNIVIEASRASISAAVKVNRIK